MLETAPDSFSQEFLMKAVKSATRSQMQYNTSLGCQVFSAKVT